MTGDARPEAFFDPLGTSPDPATPGHTSEPEDAKGGTQEDSVPEAGARLRLKLQRRSPAGSDSSQASAQSTLCEPASPTERSSERLVDVL